MKIFSCVIFAFIANVSLAQHKSYRHHPHPALRSVPDSVSNKMKHEKDFLYANDPTFWQKEKQEDNSAFIKFLEYLAGSPVLKWLLYLFLAAVLIFAVYQVMVVNNFFIFSRSTGKKKSDHFAEDESSPENIDEKINTAINNKEYRVAIRFLYLKTLQWLSEKDRIRLHSKSTNHDYIEQMKKHAGGGQFRILTRIYEYVWYGEFQPDEHQFDIIRTNFNQFISQD